MRIKRKIKNAIGCAMIIGLTAVLLWHSTNLMERKISDVKNAPFFEQEEDFDVLFLGTSHMGYGVNPMELWNDYGIVSYNLAGHGTTLAITYWTMQNAFDYTTPKLAVIDCCLLSYVTKCNLLFSSVHVSLDAFPLSKTKIAAAYDLLDDEIAAKEFPESEPGSRMEVIWDYAIYHSRWNQLSEEDFETIPSIEKGAEHYAGVVTPEGVTEIAAAGRPEEDTVSIEYLEKMIEDCQSRGIDVLLTYLPFEADETCQMEADRVYDIAEEYGVDYINFLDMDVVNRATDYCDTDYHLNPSGARKVTAYIGQYITDRYELPDRRKDAAYGQWHADYEEYRYDRFCELSSLESMDKYLMMLSAQQYPAVIEVNDAGIWENEYYCDLFENLHVNPGDITRDTDFLVIGEAGTETACFENFHDSGSSGMTPLGELGLFADEETGTYGVYLNGRELYTVAPKQDAEADVRIAVMDKDTLEVVDYAYFNFQSKYSK